MRPFLLSSPSPRKNAGMKLILSAVFQIPSGGKNPRRTPDSEGRPALLYSLACVNMSKIVWKRPEGDAGRNPAPGAGRPRWRRRRTRTSCMRASYPDSWKRKRQRQSSTGRETNPRRPRRLKRKDDRSRKEVFQPHLPVRLPCYDLAPITSFALGRSSRSRTSGTPGFHGLTGGVYKARERIHRAVADARLLANPASWGRVADPSPNWDRLSRLDATYITPSLCTGHCNTCVAPDVRAVLI